MASAANNMNLGLNDPTYRQYDSQQAATYAKHRPSPPPALVELIISHHTATGGKTAVLLDVGCGPGLATRMFSEHFDVAIGADVCESMIKVATELGGESAKGEPVRWVISAAEEMDKIEGVEKGSVDLIIAAFAAHWFDMPKFWAAAAEVAAKVHAIYTRFHKDIIDTYSVEGNKISTNGYKDLILPWSENSGLHQGTAALFDRDAFVRKEIPRVGLATAAGGDSDTANAVAKDPPATSVLQRVEKLFNTFDPVTRWRDAHPELMGTDKDCVKVLIAETVEAVRDGKDNIDLRALLPERTTVVLLVKRVIV